MSRAIKRLDDSTVTDLRSAVSGPVVGPDDPEYDAVRTVWNGAVDRYPCLVVGVESAADVATAVRFARDHDLSLSVRGGGHHVTGCAVADDGLVVDLSGLDGVEIDPEARTARVGAGARVGDVLGPAQEHGLAPVAGSAAQNGVSGSTLAGGIGWLRRRHGLGLDHVRSVELVTVDGETLTASESENPDLFWAVRGAGANVGIVTEFELNLVAVGPEVMVAQVAYPVADAGDVIRGFREWAETAPREATTLVALMRVPPLPMVPPEAHGAPIVMVYSVYAGAVDEGERALAPLRELGDPVMDTSGPMPLAALHDVARDLFPDARHYSWHSLYADSLADEAIDLLVTAFTDMPSPESELAIWHLGGAISDVDDDETAFGFRDAAFMLTVDAAWDDPSLGDANAEWARRYWTALRPHSMDGFYPGFPGFVAGEELGRMAYGDNYDRLAEVKARYDPENLLRNNTNVEPAA